MTEKGSDEFFGHYLPSRDFLSDSRFRNLCSILDLLESGGKGWTAVAEALEIDLEPREVHTIKKQQERSPSAIFFNAYFQRKLDDEADVMDTLASISEACKDVLSFQPKSIVDDEINEKETLQVCTLSF